MEGKAAFGKNKKYIVIVIILLLLLRNPIFTQNYDDKQFLFLSKPLSLPFIRLRTIFIKTSNLILCRQKEVVYNLTLLSH